MRRVHRAVHRLRPVALLQPLGDVAVRRGQQAVLEARQLGHHLARPEIRPHHVAELARRVGQDGNLAAHARVGVHVRHVHALAVDVVLPAVVHAAQAALLVAPEEEIRAAVRAARLDQPHLAVGVAEGDQVLAHHLDADRRAVGLGHFARERDRQPVPAEVLAHRGARAGARQQFVVGGAQHDGGIFSPPRPGRRRPCGEVLLPTFSALNLAARSRIVVRTFSAAGSSPWIQRSGLMRATTKD